MKDSKIVFGQMLDYYRKKEKLTMEELGKSLGKTPSTISRWISGERSPKMYEVEEVIKLFNTDVETMLFGANSTSSTSQSEIEEEYHNEDVWSYDFYDVGIAAGATESITRDYKVDEDVEQIEISDEVMGRYARNSDIAFTRVNGDSMNKVIPHNSLIAIKRIENISDFENDDIILFSYEDGFSIKRFYNDKENEQLIFSPESTSRGYHDIVVPYDLACELRIIGKVVLYIVHVE